jgi:hypothetical protein
VAECILTCITGDIAVQTAEDDIDLILELLGSAVFDNQISQLFAHRKTLLPFDGIAVFLARRSRAGSDCCELEAWVQGEKKDESLADTTSRTQDTYPLETL